MKDELENLYTNNYLNDGWNL